MRLAPKACAGLMAAAAAAAVVALGAAGQVSAPAPTPAAAGGPQLVTQYCLGCHSDRAKIGGLSLEHADYDNVGSHADTWERVVRKLQSGQMPPVGRPRPHAAAVKTFVSSLE